MTIWYFFVHLADFFGFGIMFHEKSGNAAPPLGRCISFFTLQLQLQIESH
jgi:hypothetical protein